MISVCEKRNCILKNNDNVFKKKLTKVCRYFAILHGTGGGVMRPPRVWLLSELKLRLKKQRVACHETKPLTPEFKVLGQPVTSEVRSMTQN